MDECDDGFHSNHVETAESSQIKEDSKEVEIEISDQVISDVKEQDDDDWSQGDIQDLQLEVHLIATRFYLLPDASRTQQFAPKKMKGSRRVLQEQDVAVRLHLYLECLCYHLTASLVETRLVLEAMKCGYLLVMFGELPLSNI